MYENRAAVERDFEVDEYGFIISPGKFEGERAYVPYLWSSGDGDVSEEGEYSFSIILEDLEEFPELEGKAYVILLETDQGFVIEV